MAEGDENATNLQQVPPTPQAPHTLSTIKLLILKKAIKSRFGGNDESKKMQKYIMQQQFEGFSVSNLEGLHKGYNRFQSLLSQVEIHGAGVSTEDQKFLRTNSTNEVSTAYGVSTSSGHNSQKEGSSSYIDDLMYSFFDNQSSGPQLDHEDLEQVDEFDLEKMDLKWQVAMISTRLKKFYKKTRRKLHFDAKEPVGFDKSKDEHKAMVTIDGEGVDWTGHAEDNTEDYALMDFNSSNSGSDTESSDVEDSHVNDRFEKVKGMHAVPLPMTRNYMPLKSDFGIDESKFTYGPKYVETLESVPKPVESKPKVVSEPKVWSDAPIIEDQDTCSHNPKVDKKDWTGLKSKRMGLGYGYIKKACFVCGSFSHLIRDCDFHEKRMAKQVELNKSKNKVNCQRNDRPMWNNVQRLNHQNKFVPTAILTKTSRFLVNAAR
uniref:Ribonuclease H-like domain-containing protein n=1 Tax=Tanacetum cinerariifolium TaxID=118510 RepID=A0A699HLA5_TANCI|nr:ribonuclease H-like domain-containing protein [Tanacetum cinerariifolium]GEY37468.1 ribonuclease H-like domain-containing protein [Tanacetum cinerariifolium]